MGDRELLNDAIQLLEQTETGELHTLRDWDDWRARRNALLCRYREQAQHPAPEPFVTRQELGAVLRALAQDLHNAAWGTSGLVTCEEAARPMAELRVFVERLRAGQDARGEMEGGR